MANQSNFDKSVSNMRARNAQKVSDTRQAKRDMYVSKVQELHPDDPVATVKAIQKAYSPALKATDNSGKAYLESIGSSLPTQDELNIISEGSRMPTTSEVLGGVPDDIPYQLVEELPQPAQVDARPFGGRTWAQAAGDTALSLEQGVINLFDIGTTVADTFTTTPVNNVLRLKDRLQKDGLSGLGDYVTKDFRVIDNGLGDFLKLDKASEFVDTFKSDSYQYDKRTAEQDYASQTTIGGKAKSVVDNYILNPTLGVDLAAQSAPQMFAGGWIGRVAKGIPTGLRAAFGEGTITSLGDLTEVRNSKGSVGYRDAGLSIVDGVTTGYLAKRLGGNSIFSPEALISGTSTGMKRNVAEHALDLALQPVQEFAQGTASSVFTQGMEMPGDNRDFTDYIPDGLKEASAAIYTSGPAAIPLGAAIAAKGAMAGTDYAVKTYQDKFDNPDVWMDKSQKKFNPNKGFTHYAQQYNNAQTVEERDAAKVQMDNAINLALQRYDELDQAYQAETDPKKKVALGKQLEKFKTKQLAPLNSTVALQEQNQNVISDLLVDATLSHDQQLTQNLEYDSSLPADEQQAPVTSTNGSRLIAVMGDSKQGDTGTGSGDHYHIQLGDGSNPYAAYNRLQVIDENGNAISLNEFRKTRKGNYSQQRKGYKHKGDDFGFQSDFGGNKAFRRLYSDPKYPIKSITQGNEQPSKTNPQAAGNYSIITYEDGVQVKIFHQNASGVNEVMSGGSAQAKGTKGSIRLNQTVYAFNYSADADSNAIGLAGNWSLGKLGKLSDGVSRRLVASILKTESSGGDQHAVEKKSGAYIGKYQLGLPWLESVGLIKKGTAKRVGKAGYAAALRDNNNWTRGSYSEFLRDAEMQDEAFKIGTDKNYQVLEKKGLLKDKSEIEIAGLLKAAHISGIAGAIAVARGNTTKADSNGTTGNKYYNDLVNNGDGLDSAHSTMESSAAVEAGNVEAAIESTESTNTEEKKKVEGSEESTAPEVTSEEVDKKASDKEFIATEIISQAHLLSQKQITQILNSGVLTDEQKAELVALHSQNPTQTQGKERLAQILSGQADFNGNTPQQANSSTDSTATTTSSSTMPSEFATPESRAQYQQDSIAKIQATADIKFDDAIEDLLKEKYDLESEILFNSLDKATEAAKQKRLAEVEDLIGQDVIQQNEQRKNARYEIESRNSFNNFEGYTDEESFLINEYRLLTDLFNPITDANNVEKKAQIEKLEQALPLSYLEKQQAEFDQNHFDFVGEENTHAISSRTVPRSLAKQTTTAKPNTPKENPVRASVGLLGQLQQMAKMGILSQDDYDNLRVLSSVNHQHANKATIKTTRNDLLHGFTGADKQSSFMGLVQYNEQLVPAIQNNDTNKVSQLMYNLARITTSQRNKANAINELAGMTVPKGQSAYIIPTKTKDSNGMEITQWNIRVGDPSTFTQQEKDAIAQSRALPYARAMKIRAAVNEEADTLDTVHKGYEQHIANLQRQGQLQIGLKPMNANAGLNQPVATVKPSSNVETLPKGSTTTTVPGQATEPARIVTVDTRTQQPPADAEWVGTTGKGVGASNLANIVNDKNPNQIKIKEDNIGKAGWLGNPFSQFQKQAGKFYAATKEEAVQKYMDLFKLGVNNSEAFLDAVLALRGKRLSTAHYSKQEAEFLDYAINGMPEDVAKDKVKAREWINNIQAKITLDKNGKLKSISYESVAPVEQPIVTTPTLPFDMAEATAVLDINNLNPTQQKIVDIIFEILDKTLEARVSSKSMSSQVMDKLYGNNLHGGSNSPNQVNLDMAISDIYREIRQSNIKNPKLTSEEITPIEKTQDEIDAELDEANQSDLTIDDISWFTDGLEVVDGEVVDDLTPPDWFIEDSIALDAAEEVDLLLQEFEQSEEKVATITKRAFVEIGLDSDSVYITETASKQSGDNVVNLIDDYLPDEVLHGEEQLRDTDSFTTPNKLAGKSFKDMTNSERRIAQFREQADNQGLTARIESLLYSGMSTTEVVDYLFEEYVDELGDALYSKKYLGDLLYGVIMTAGIPSRNTSKEKFEQAVEDYKQRQDNHFSEVFKELPPQVGDLTEVQKWQNNIKDKVAHAKEISSGKKIVFVGDQLGTIAVGLKTRSPSLYNWLRDLLIAELNYDIEHQAPSASIEKLPEKGALIDPMGPKPDGLIKTESTELVKLGENEIPANLLNTETGIFDFIKAMAKIKHPKMKGDVKKVVAAIAKVMADFKPDIKIVLEPEATGLSYYDAENQVIHLRGLNYASIDELVTRMLIQASNAEVIEQLKVLGKDDDYKLHKLNLELNTIRDDLQDILKERLADDSLPLEIKNVIYYALSDNVSLLSVALTNPTMMEFLNTLTETRQSKRDGTLFKRIAKSVMSFFGFTQDRPTETIYERLLTASINAAEIQNKNVKNPFKESKAAMLHIMNQRTPTKLAEERAKPIKQQNKFLLSFEQRQSTALARIPALAKAIESNMLQAVNNLYHSEMDAAQERQLKDFLYFKKEFSKFLIASYLPNNVVKNKSGEVVDYRRNDMKDYLVTRDGEGNFTIDDNTLTALSLAAYSWVLENGHKNKNTIKDIKVNLLNIKEDDNPTGFTSDMIEAYQHIGQPQAYVTEKLGKDFVRLMGIRSTKEASKHAESQLHMSVGAWVLSAMQQADLIKANTMNTQQHIKNIKSVGGKVSDSVKIDDISKDSVSTFISVTDINGQNKNQRLNQISALNKGTKGFLSDIFGIDIGLRTPTLAAPNSVKLKIKGSKASITKKQEAAMAEMQKGEYKVNEDLYDVVTDLYAEDEEFLLDLLGARVTPEQLAKTHLAKRVAKENSVEGKKRDLLNAIDWISGLERTKDGFQSFWDRVYGARNSRMHYNANMFNRQSSLLHRVLAEYATDRVVIDPSKLDLNDLYEKDGLPKIEVLFIRAVAENAEGTKDLISAAIKAKNAAYDDFTVDKLSSMDYVEPFYNYMTTDADVLAAVEAMGALLDKQVLTGEQKTAIAKVVSTWDMEAQSLRALLEWTKFQRALSNNEKLTTSFILGSDGVNNGTAISAIQNGILPNINFLYQIAVIPRNAVRPEYEDIENYFDTRKYATLGDFYEDFRKLLKETIDSSEFANDPQIQAIKRINKNLLERKTAKDALIPFGYNAGMPRIQQVVFSRFLSDLQDMMVKFATMSDEQFAEQEQKYLQFQEDLRTLLRNPHFTLPAGKDRAVLMNVWLNESQLITLEKLYSLNIGRLVRDNMFKYTGDFASRRQQITDMHSAAERMYIAAYEKVVAHAESVAKAKDPERFEEEYLTNAEWDELVVAPLEKVRASIETIFSHDQEQYDDERFGGIDLFDELGEFTKNNGVVESKTIRRGVDPKTNQPKAITRMNRLTFRIFKPVTGGLFPASASVQSVDAYVASRATIAGGKVSLNVHDSASPALDNYQAVVQEQNRSYFEALAEYHAHLESFKAIINVMEGLFSLANDGIMSEDDVYAMIEKQAIPSLFNNDKALEDMFNARADLATIMAYVLNKAKGVEQDKFNILDNFKVVHQYAGEGGQYNIGTEQLQYLKDQRESMLNSFTGLEKRINKMFGTASEFQHKPVNKALKKPYAKYHDYIFSQDQQRSLKATQYIGAGKAGTPADVYASEWGVNANTGNYTQDDIVFIHLNGGQNAEKYTSDKLIKNLVKARDAGAVLLLHPEDARSDFTHEENQFILVELLDRKYVELPYKKDDKGNDIGSGVFVPVDRVEYVSQNMQFLSPFVKVPVPKQDDTTGPLNIHSQDVNGYEALSNLALRPFTLNGYKFYSVEHAYQTLKSGKFDKDTYELPNWAKGGVRNRGPERENANTEEGKKANYDLMEKLVRHSFNQNAKAKKLLMKTGDRNLTHLSPQRNKQDVTWETAFPEILMKIRDEFNGKPPTPPKGPQDFNKENFDLLKTLNSIAAKDTVPANLRAMASIVYNALSKRGDIPPITSSDEQLFLENGSEAVAWYDYQTNAIKVNRAKFGAMDTEAKIRLLLHEALHALTEHAIQNPTPETEQALIGLRQLANEIHANLTPEQLKSLGPVIFDLDDAGRIAELISYGLTDEYFQKILVGTKLDSSWDSKLKGMRNLNGFGAFIEFVKKLFNFKGKTHLDALVKLTSDLVSKSPSFVPVQSSAANQVRASLGPVNQAIASRVNAMTPMEVLKGMDKGIISDKHNALLDNMIDKFIGDFYNNTPDGNQIVNHAISNTMSRAVKAGFNLSEKEEYVNEVLMSVFKAHIAAHSGVSVINEYRKLYSEITNADNPNFFTVYDLEPNYDNLTKAEKQLVSKKVNYIKGATVGNKQGDFLPRFIALTIASQEMYDAMNMKRERNKKAAKTLSEKILNFIGSVFEWLLGELLKTNRKNVSSQIVALTQDLRKIDIRARNRTNNKLRRVWFEGQKVTKFANSLLIGGVQKSLSKLNVSDFKSEAIRDMISIAQTYNAKDPEVLAKAMFIVANKDGQTLSEMGLIINEMLIESSIEKTAERMLRLTQLAGRYRDETRTATIKVLKESFTRDLTKAERAAVTATLLRTDVQSLLSSGHNITGLLTMVKDPAKRTAKINELKKKLAKHPNGTDMMFQAKALGAYMALEETPDNLLKNSESIAAGLGTKFEDKKYSEDLFKTVDALASLYALDFVPKKQMNILVNLLSTEEEGVISTINAHKALVAKGKEDFKGNMYNYEKGYMPHIADPRRAMKYVTSLEDMNKLKDEGWELVNDDVLPQDPSDLSNMKMMMYHPDYDYVELRSGVLDLKDTHSRGTTIYTMKDNYLDMKRVTMDKISRRNIRNKGDIDKYDPTEDSGSLIPIYNGDGSLKSYHYEMRGSTRDSLLNRNNDFFDLMGAMHGELIYRPLVKEQQGKVADMLFEDYKTNGAKNMKDFVLLDPASIDPKVQEQWMMLPHAFRERAKELFGAGKPIPVRNLIYNTTFGYRTYTIAEMFDKVAGERNVFEKIVVGVFSILGKKYNEGRGRKYARVTEHYVQKIVKYAKETIVVRSGKVLLGNIVANMLLLLLYGVPPTDMIKGYAMAWFEGRRYTKYRAEIQELRMELAMNRSDNARKRDINNRLMQINDAITKSPMHKYMNAGLMSTIVEDTDLSTENTVYEDALDKKINAIAKNIPKPVKDLTNFLAMSKGTTVYEVLADMTQYSDFGAKYILAKHLQEQNGMSFDEAVSVAQTNFINFDIPMGRGIDYLDRLGILMFIKFLLRIQKVMVHKLKKQPVTSIAQHLLVENVFNTQGFYDPFLPMRMGLNSPFSASAFIALDAEDQMLTMNVIGGLFD